MKQKNIVISVAATSLAAGVIIYLLVRKKRVQQRLAKVADEGYETAYDVLYPLKANRYFYQ